MPSNVFSTDPITKLTKVCRKCHTPLSEALLPKSARYCRTCAKSVASVKAIFREAKARLKAKESLIKRLAREKERKTRKKERRLNRPPVLKRRLDALVSEYVRRRAADVQGNVTCPLCGRRVRWQEAQNMHYNSRARMNTRYDLRNCLAGEYACNVARNGNYPAYTKYLLNTYGEAWLKQLIADGEKIKQWTVPELQSEITRYTNLLKQL